MAFLRTLLILFIIFYVVRIFTRYFLPALFRNYMDDKIKDLQQKEIRNRQKQQQQAKRNEGKVTIDYRGNTGKNKHLKGDYVDYVEVKD